MENDFTFWESSLLALAAGKPVPSIPDINKPEPGYYRMSGGKGKAPEAVAFWYDNGSLLCTINGKSTEDLRARKAWPFAAKNPVDYDVFRRVSGGAPWPDLPAGLMDERSAPSASGPVPTSHNEPPPEHEVLRDTVDNAVKAGAAYTKVADDETAKQAQSARARLNELSGEAEKKRVAEKAPVIALGKEVDGKWAPTRDKAKEEADRIAKLLSAWETKKANAARAKAVAEAQAAAAAAATATPGVQPAPQPPAPAAAAAPPPSTSIRGGYGRAAGVQVVKVITAVTDQDALYRQFRAEADVQDLLRKKAQRLVDLGHEVLGVTVEEERKVV